VSAPPAAACPARAGERGFTLIELMIALVVSSLLVGFLFSMTRQIGDAFRAQRRVTDVQQTLRTVGALMASDLRQAGFLVSAGFRTSAWGTPDLIVQPLQIVNDADGTGPDLIRIYYADPSASGRVTAIDPAARQWADVQHAAGFEVGDLAVLVNAELLTGADGKPDGVAYESCVVRVTGVDAGDPGRIHFAASAPINTSTNQQCAAVAAETDAEGASTDTAIYRFVGRSYRVDPERRDLGVLQGSPTGELVPDDWTDLALGVTTIQVASRYREPGDLVDRDGDGDAEQDWYSSENQETPDPTGTRPAGALLAELTLSIETRSSLREADTPSAESGSFTVEGAAANNPLGDWPSVALAATPDADRPVGYRGRHAYRWSTTRVDLRNLAVRR